MKYVSYRKINVVWFIRSIEKRNGVVVLRVGGCGNRVLKIDGYKILVK